jgi:hypothetical protein
VEGDHVRAVRQVNNFESAPYRISDELPSALAFVEMRKNDPIVWDRSPKDLTPMARLTLLNASDDPGVPSARAALYLAFPDVRPPNEQISLYELEQMCRHVGCRTVVYGGGWDVIEPDGKKHWFPDGDIHAIIPFATARFQQIRTAPVASAPVAASADDGDDDDAADVSPDTRPAYTAAAQRIQSELAQTSPTLQRLLLVAISAYEDVGLMRADGLDGLLDVLTTGLVMCDDEQLAWAVGE